MRVLDGELSVAEAWRLSNQSKVPKVSWPLWGVLAAASDVLRTANIDIDFNPSKPDYSLDDDGDWDEGDGYRDAAGWGAYVMAGGTVDDPKADASKRREFWEWWLSEAIPAAWQMVQRAKRTIGPRDA
jgi:hypothetical protein